jgi:hypothetical protein
MKGLLVRVGIDSTDGCWNAPMRLASEEFVYVTITDPKPLRDGMARRLDELIPVAKRFGEQLPPPLPGLLPPPLLSRGAPAVGRIACQI